MNLVSHILLYIMSWMDFAMLLEAVLERLIQRKKNFSSEDISLTYFKRTCETHQQKDTQEGGQRILHCLGSTQWILEW